MPRCSALEAWASPVGCILSRSVCLFGVIRFGAFGIICTSQVAGSLPKSPLLRRGPKKGNATGDEYDEEQGDKDLGEHATSKGRRSNSTGLAGHLPLMVSSSGSGDVHAESASVPIRQIPAALTASATTRMAKTESLRVLDTCYPSGREGFGMSDQERSVRRLGKAPALTGIRAVAIGLVILVHTNISAAQGGWIGVDVFFVLSGFLITALLLNEHDANGRFSIPKFYVRRIFRLVPAYWAFLLIVVVWAAIWRSSQFDSWSSEVVKNATYQMNYFDIDHYPQVGVGHGWSLAIEEQFYLVWPLLLLVGLKFMHRRVFAGLVVVGILASFLATVVMAQHGVSYRRLYYGLDTNALPLLVGCLAAFLYTGGYGRKISPHRSALIPFVTMVVLAFFLVSVPEQSEWAYEGPIQLVSLLTAATLIAILLNPNTWVARILAHPAIVFVGLISYSLYLWNPFAMLIARNLATGTVGRALHLFVGLILTFGFALASYYLIERPGLRLKDRFEVNRSVSGAPSPAGPSHS